MLPYHLRPPSAGKKKGVKKIPDGVVADYPNGGPIQRAIQEDLLDVRGDFVRELQLGASSPVAGRHGASFAVCKRIFRRRKVAALHTKFIPPRCDQAAFSQMIYAACLAVLPRQLGPPAESGASTSNAQDSSPATDDLIPAIGDSTPAADESTRRTQPAVIFLGTLIQAAFALFSLYILHETNPIPRAEDAKGFELLPMGLRNRTNQRRSFHRRSFRPWIRVCRSTMASLSYWREYARAVVSHPEDATMLESMEKRTAEDVLVVLERLWKQLDFVSYTGPRSLEALAGHPGFPYFATEATTSASSAPVGLEDTEAGTDTTEIDGILQGKMQEYLQCRRGIRFVPPKNARQRRRVESVQNALRPMFGDTTGPSLEETLQRLRHNFSATTLLQSKPRMVTFSIVESAGLPGDNLHDDAITLAGDDKDGPIPVDAASKSQGLEEDEPDSYELVLPLDTPEALRRSLEAAVQTLIEQDQMALMGNILSTVAVPEELHDDGISTLAAPTVAPSVASTRTGVGRDLLLDLLGRVEEAGSRSERGSIASLPRRRSDFLEDAELVTPVMEVVKDLSDVSGDEDGNDALSAAVSSIGRRAILELLDSAPASSKKSQSKMAKNAKRKNDPEADMPQWEFRMPRKRGRPKKKFVFSDENTEARSTSGADALGSLLAASHSKKKDAFSVTSEANTEARSTAGIDALRSLLPTRHSKEKDAFSVASEANTEARSTAGAGAGAGAGALGLLLARASAKDDCSLASETNTEAQSTTGNDALGLLLAKRRSKTDDFSVASEANTEAAQSTAGNDALGLLLSKR
jgi:hypothetical protein